MFIRGCSIVRLFLAILVVLGLCSLTASSCSENGDCVNGYCQTESCVCNKGWWGNVCQYCRLRLTDDQGVITDGETKYQSRTTCSWLVESKRPNTTINLRFEQFATECTWDHLYVYDGKSIDGPLIAVLSGLIRDRKIKEFANESILELQTKSGAAFLYFYSDENYVLNGFNIKYKITPDCLADCSYHGNCNSTGGCTCHSGWTGEKCNVATCPVACVNGNCDQQLRQCVCDPHYKGASCNVTHERSVWSQYVSDNQDLVQGRASHAVGQLGDYMWVYGGIPLNEHPFNDLVRYNFQMNSWEAISPASSLYGVPSNRYGHSLVVFNNSLLVFGGRVAENVVNELWSFNTKTRQWTLVVPSKDGAKPLAVAGHTATVVGDKMIVLFGYSNTEGFTGKVQELNLATNTWSISSVNYSVYRGSFGHSSVYHPAKRRIYIHGGYREKPGTTLTTELSSELTAYDPFKKTWFALTSSGQGRFLHSAAVVGGLMLVYGGNKHQSIDESKKNYKCYANHFLGYDITCDKWYGMPELGLPHEIGRFGHSALMLNRTMYVFGGFRGTMLNDILTFSLGDCSAWKDKKSCLAASLTSQCVWSQTNTCEPESMYLPLKDSLECPDKKLCQHQSNCSRCLSSPHGCEWCGRKCLPVGKCSPRKQKVDNLLKCPEHKKTACDAGKCSTSCYNATTCEACTDKKLTPDSSRCIWCESARQCVEITGYVVSFPYGQCHAWEKNDCNVVKCSAQKTCDDCHTLPGCGWCDDGSGTGLGQCMEGGDEGPVTRIANATRPNQCPKESWFFVECPACQCNGHATCNNGNICNKCSDATAGHRCERCMDKFFGNAKNGGKCEACQCNGHAKKCNPTTGVCNCQEEGVNGSQCERCESERKITGNATNGGHCYFVLSADYRYTFPVSNKTQINFQNVPDQDDIDVTLDVEIESGEIAAKVKLSWINDNSDGETFLIEDKTIGRLEETISHDDYLFGGSDRLTLRVYVYDMKKPIRLKISITQKRTFLIMNFFITFFGCFFSLLFVVTVAWKIKVRYANYVMSQRRMVEMKQMASRPFAKLSILLVAPGDEDEESEEETTRMRTPSSIALQPFDVHPCAVSSVLVRLPTDHNGLTPIGQSGICCASAIVTHGEACNAHAHPITRTPRKPVKHRLMRTCLT